MAIGSPQPGHRLCSPTSMSAGVKSSTRCAGSVGGASVGRKRSVMGRPSRRGAPGCGRAGMSPSRSGAMPKPEPSRLSRPMNSTGTAPRDREAHVVDHLALVVLVHRDHAWRRRRRAATASDGNGSSVIGRTYPTRAPSARSRATAARTYFAGVPNATTTTSASSGNPVSASGSMPASISSVATRALACSARRGRSRRASLRLVVPSGDTSRAWPVPLGGPVERPVVGRRRGRSRRGADRDRLRRVREVVVAEQQHRVAPPLREVERELGELDRLGHVHRREHGHARVAVAGPARRLPVVALGPRHVEHDERDPRVGRARPATPASARAPGRSSRWRWACRWRPRPTPCRPPRARSRRSCTCRRPRGAWPPCARAPR